MAAEPGGTKRASVCIIPGKRAHVCMHGIDTRFFCFPIGPPPGSAAIVEIWKRLDFPSFLLKLSTARSRRIWQERCTRTAEQRVAYPKIISSAGSASRFTKRFDVVSSTGRVPSPGTSDGPCAMLRPPSTPSLASSGRFPLVSTSERAPPGTSLVPRSCEQGSCGSS